MKHQKVIKLSQLPAKPPIVATIAYGLLLDRFHAPAWLWGVVGTLAAILWIFTIVAMCIQDPVMLKELTTAADTGEKHGA